MTSIQSVQPVQHVRRPKGGIYRITVKTQPKRWPMSGKVPKPKITVHEHSAWTPQEAQMIVRNKAELSGLEVLQVLKTEFLR